MSVKEQSAIFPDGKLICLQGRDQRLSEKVLFPLQEGSLRINYDLTNRGAWVSICHTLRNFLYKVSIGSICIGSACAKTKQKWNVKLVFVIHTNRIVFICLVVWDPAADLLAEKAWKGNSLTEVSGTGAKQVASGPGSVVGSLYLCQLASKLDSFLVSLCVQFNNNDCISFGGAMDTSTNWAT